ncbi:MAG TPA: hypothetical protein VFD49_20625 [Candidatus Dormibacteraeota bacterium]|nr:hypothetical protein [Candidatus Dormibacteraeota bacterium]
MIDRCREAGITGFILDHPRDDQLDVLERVAAGIIPGCGPTLAVSRSRARRTGRHYARARRPLAGDASKGIG